MGKGVPEYFDEASDVTGFVTQMVLVMKSLSLLEGCFFL